MAVVYYLNLRHIYLEEWESALFLYYTLCIMDIPEITALNYFILQNSHITINVKQLPSYLKQSKLHPALIIPDLQREIGRLRQYPM